MDTELFTILNYVLKKQFIYTQCDAVSNDRRTKLNKMFLFTLRLHMRVDFLCNRTKLLLLTI